jgi:hypothetical protein
MATTKKKPAAKVAAKKPTTARKVTPKSSAKKTKVAEHRSFRPSVEKAPFMTFKFTEQSAYWLILCVLVLALGAWVMYLNVKIQNIYDQVEINTQFYENYATPSSATQKPAAAEPTAQ